MTVRSASEGLSVLPSAEPSAEPEVLVKPPEKRPARVPSAPFTYRRALAVSLLLHGLVLSAASLLGVHPSVALGNPWGSPWVDSSAFTLVMAPSSSGDRDRGASTLGAETLVLDPLEHEPPLLPPSDDSALVELAIAEVEVAELLDSLSALPPPAPEAEPDLLAADAGLAAEPSDSELSASALARSGDHPPSLAPLAPPGAHRGLADHGLPRQDIRGQDLRGPDLQGSGGTGARGDGEPSPLGLPDGTLGGYLPPTFAALTPPDYPHSARRLGHQGSALIRIHVSAGGSVLDVELVESSGHELLDQTALSAARAWRFHAATQDGVAIAGSLLHRVTFRLEER